MYRLLVWASLIVVFAIWQSFGSVAHAVEGSTHEFPVCYCQGEDFTIDGDTYSHSWILIKDENGNLTGVF